MDYSLLISLSYSMPVPYYFDYYKFVILCVIRKCDDSRFVLLSQDWFGYLVSLGSI